MVSKSTRFTKKRVKKKITANIEDVDVFNWKPYKGVYEKLWYDIKLEDGSILTNCYPNAGFFHSFDGDEDGDCCTVDEDDVVAFKIRDTDANRFAMRFCRQ